jgi:SAM-dependent methyltransferase
VLDVGCAQGRSAAKLRDLDVEIVGFDISKALVAQAQSRARAEGWRARVSFFVGDATRFPVADGAFDYVLVYGVLHHLPDPAAACLEIARVLAPGGVYFGSENNRSVFRAIFDGLQRLFPLWHEEAGAQPLMSRADFHVWLGAAGLALSARTRVFVPPHLCNYLSVAGARRALKATDALGGAMPFLRDQGGLILVRAQSIAQPSRSDTVRHHDLHDEGA